MNEPAKGRDFRWINAVLLLFGSLVWLFNAYKLLTGLRTMGLIDGLSAGMCFFIGPAILWGWLSRIRGERN